MAVTRTSIGAFNAGTAGVTVAFGAGATAGDLGLLFVETANQALPSTPSGWTQEIQAGFGSAGAAGATMLSVYSKKSITAGDISGGVATGDSGDHQGGRLVTYSGYDSTTPIVITQSGQDTSTSSTSVILSTAVSSTTVTANDIVLAAVATDKDTSTSSTNSAQTWNNISGSHSNIINNSTVNGAGGGLIVDELVPSGTQSAAVTFTETITASAWIGRVIVIKASAGGTGTLAKTLAAVTTSSNGSLTSRIATLSGTLGALTTSSAAKLKISGTLAKTLGTLTTSSSAKLKINGTLAKTLDTLTVSSAAKLKINGTFSTTLGTLTTSSAAKLYISATLAKTLGSLTTSSVGTLYLRGSLTATLGSLTGSETGHLLIQGSLSRTLGNLTSASSGQLLIRGSVSTGLGSLTGSETGQLLIKASLSGTLSPVLLASNGSLSSIVTSTNGSLTITLGSLTSSSTTQSLQKLVVNIRGGMRSSIIDQVRKSKHRFHTAPYRIRQ